MENKRSFTSEFYPDIVLYSQDYQKLLNDFDAGLENYSFNEFIQKEACDCMESGEGVTYLVFNSTDESDKELVAYFTLCSGAIPYIERWKIPEEEQEDNGIEYEEMHCGIPSIELKMFAVSQKYQNIFYSYEGESKPIAAWILSDIINIVYSMKSTIIGVKALYLRSVPDAENFYAKNGFDYVLKPMNPFYSIDSDFKAMYIPFSQIKIHYDE